MSIKNRGTYDPAPASRRRLTIPGKGHTLEFERIQYGVAVPLTLGGTHSIGALIQVRISLDE